MNAVIKVKSKDYLIGFIDGLIRMKNKSHDERLEIKNNEIFSFKEQNEVLGSSYLSLTCQCGNYVAFENSEEIPDKNLKCSLCDDVFLILYTDE